MIRRDVTTNNGADRRRILKASLAAGVGALLSSLPAAAQDTGAAARPKEGDLLVRADDPEHRPLRPEDITLNGRQVAAWAMDPADRTVRSGSRLNALILLRLDAATLAPETRARAADGVVAYTAICTHNGCDVDDWIADRRALSCSCHQSEFDPRDAARVLDGPAPRALPALPLKIADGALVVARPFTSRVGFDPGPLR
jgi:rieske iron-sulfur protein